MANNVLGYVPSKSGGAAHPIKLGRDGVVYCDCRGWKFRKTCSHLPKFFADALQASVDEAANVERLFQRFAN